MPLKQQEQPSYGAHCGIEGRLFAREKHGLQALQEAAVFCKDPKLPRVTLRDGTLTSTARVRELVSVADLAQCCYVHADQLLGETARAFDACADQDAEAGRDREIVNLPPLIAGPDSLAGTSGRRASRTAETGSIARTAGCRSAAGSASVSGGAFERVPNRDACKRQ